MAPVWLSRLRPASSRALAVGGDGVVDRMPVTGELSGDFLHRPAPTHLDRRPLGRPGLEQAVLGGDAVVGEREGLGPACPRAPHAVLFPGQGHGHAVDRRVDVAHHRSVFNLRPLATTGAGHRPHHLLDEQLDIGAAALVVQDADVFQAYQSGHYLIRVA